MSDDFQLGLVGCGMLAERGYLPALRRAHGVRLVAVADQEPSRAARLAPHLPHHPSAEALLAAHEVEGIVLATPAAAHLDDARLASAAGVAVLVEKPPAANVREADALTELDRPPWMGFNRRFDRDLQRLRETVPAEARVALTLELHNPTGSWRSYVADEDALLRLGPHLIDLARWLTDSEIERVRALELTRTSARFDLQLDRGSARISCATDRPARNRIEVRRDGARPIATYSGSRFFDRVRRRLRGGDSLVQLLVLELQAFVEAARTGCQPILATAVDGAAVMAAIDATRASSEQNRSWIGVAAEVS